MCVVSTLRSNDDEVPKWAHHGNYNELQKGKQQKTNRKSSRLLKIEPAAPPDTGVTRHICPRNKFCHVCRENACARRNCASYRHFCHTDHMDKFVQFVSNTESSLFDTIRCVPSFVSSTWPLSTPCRILLHTTNSCPRNLTSMLLFVRTSKIRESRISRTF